MPLSIEETSFHMQNWSHSAVGIRILGVLWILFIEGALGVMAQPVQRLTTGFEGDVSRYRWLSEAFMTRDVGLWSVFFQNQFVSEAFLINQEVSGDFRDENALQWRVRRRFNAKVSGVVFGTADWYSQNQAFSQELYAGIRYQPRSFLEIEPSVFRRAVVNWCRISKFPVPMPNWLKRKRSITGVNR